MTQTDYSWHSKAWDQFVAAYSQNHLPHALLLTGSQGVGKLAFSQRLVTSLLCLNPDIKTKQACGQCQACKTYESGANPDFMNIQLLEDKQQIGVDQIRRLSEFLTYSRSFNAYRVVLIHPVERMNQNAANSLLKSLEEPADNTVIILTATHLSKVMPTIKSRSQLLNLPLPTRQQAIDWIKQKKPDFKNIEELLEMSHGSPLLAIQTSDDVLEKRNELAKDILNIVEKNNSVIEIAKKWEKFDLEMLLDWQIIWLQQFLKKINAPNSRFSQAHSKILQNLEQIIVKEQLWVLYQQLILKKKTIHTSVNPLMNIENMLTLWLQASPL